MREIAATAGCSAPVMRKSMDALSGLLVAIGH